MVDPARHSPLREVAWDADEAQRGIDEIVADAVAHYGPRKRWPAHPSDERVTDGAGSLYFGAAGMIWGLDYLSREGAASAVPDFKPALAPLLKHVQAAMTGMGAYKAHGSLLMTDLGVLLVMMRIAPAKKTADLIEDRCGWNDKMPVRELMWGTPGSMLACLHMADLTGEDRWRGIFEGQAKRLLKLLRDDGVLPIWSQTLYGRSAKFLGPVHGYAGNMIPLMRGWDWLSDEQRAQVKDAVPRTLEQTAWRTKEGANWHARVVADEEPKLCQYCHGAAGMVTSFADAPFSTPILEKLMLEGGAFTWAKGPLSKGGGLCHGTGGNGYAFLKLYQRTGDKIWLERARAFAMTALAQCREARGDLGRGRFTLWTGDVGLAVYLWHCLSEQAAFPTLDVF